jgi:hypothetical protein
LAHVSFGYGFQKEQNNGTLGFIRLNRKHTMDNVKIIRARGAAMSSIGVLLHHDRETLMQIMTWVKEHLLAEEAMAVRAMFEANEAIRKAQNGKA